MADRGFTEVDLRRMLERARGYRRDIVAGRWIIETRQRRGPWEVIVDRVCTGRPLVPKADCNDHNACKHDYCDPDLGCMHAPSPRKASLHPTNC
jgi:hypothetical protein